MTSNIVGLAGNLNRPAVARNATRNKARSKAPNSAGATPAVALADVPFAILRALWLSGQMLAETYVAECERRGIEPTVKI